MRLLIVLLLLLAAADAPTLAATFVVTKQADDDGLCTVDDCALREAVLAANALGGADRIEIPGGVYALTLTGPVEENAGLTGDLDILDELELVGADGVVIVGDGTDRVIQSSGTHQLTIENITVTGGFTTNTGGGIRGEGTLLLRNVIVRGNESLGDGGGVFVLIDNAMIVDSTITDNRAPHGRGGGLYGVGFDLFDELEIVNATISGNHALSGGGAYLSGAGVMRLVNMTFAENTADFGFGQALVNDGSVNLSFSSTLVANNSCGYISAIPHSNGHNMEGPTASCFVPGDGDAIGVPDIMLEPLADNGGPTPTHALLPGSAAIDVALDADCPATDQRGVVRPQDGDEDGSAVCDVGAFELVGPGSVLQIPTISRTGMVVSVVLVAFLGLRVMRRRLC